MNFAWIFLIAGIAVLLLAVIIIGGIAWLDRLWREWWR